MKTKKLIFGALFSLVFGLLVVMGFDNGPLVASQTEVEAVAGSGLDCKVEVISCGWGKGNRQICHVNGNGLTCTPCGDSTECS